ncbi:MAG: MBL fold metallo-hydrolase [Alphaproteobacteria bacterium]|nr:MBL fold metallo-hydrolase [Alphaproteobacteria bacterium]
MKLSFFGAVGTVTGSRFLLEDDGFKVLVDCGLFQGFKQLRLRNWAPFPVDPRNIDAVVLTHAHLDHSGYIPLLVKNGFGHKVWCTPATRDLCAILLPDSGYLLERDAEFAQRHGFSKHHPPRPLYTQRDAQASLDSLSVVDPGGWHALTKDMRFRFRPAGHILGAAIVEFSAHGRTIVFSGDLGRPNSATMLDPTPIEGADYLIVESTYGDRQHVRTDPEDVLADIINRTAARGGSVIIPSFAVGRAQTLLFHLERLKSERRIPNLPVFLDSPMAIDASEVFCAHVGAHRLTAAQSRKACHVAHYVTGVEESKSLDQSPLPKVIISASGMATGGRVLHHLKHYAPDPRNAIVFAGFQAGGTRGASMVGGADSVKIHGAYVPIRAEVVQLQMLSAHADADEIMAWLKYFTAPPRETFVVHGEPAAADTLRHRIVEELGWSARVPEFRETVALD